MSQQKIEIEKSKGLEINYLETHNDNDDIQNEISNKSEICENEIVTGKEWIHLKTVHKGPKVHKCDPCGKLFTQASKLKIHIKTIHEGHKDFKCDSCG